MNLRRRLLLLLSGFAVFAVLSTLVTVFGIQWRIDSAIGSFTQAMSRTVDLDRLHVSLREQRTLLRDIVSGAQETAKPYFESREEFFKRLLDIARSTRDLGDEDHSAELVRVAQTFERDSDLCLSLVQASRIDEAKKHLRGRIEGVLIPELDGRLRRAQALLDQARHQSTLELNTTAKRTLAVTIVVGALAASLVLLGGILIRRWVMIPIAELRRATDRFSAGDFRHRVPPSSGDELGLLGSALNEMAQRVSDAGATLQASEAKHRALFRNLRDAVVICDIGGRVIECHDGDTQVLGIEGSEAIGRRVEDVWPEWRSATADWLSAIEGTASRGRRYRFPAVKIERPGEEATEETYCDFLVYRVELGEQRFAAIVVRDVTDRQRLQSRLRRAETMEAVGTLAGGLAHDFNNLLAGVTGTLSLLATEITESKHAERIRMALRACWQAAALSRRLLNFATSTHGTPQVFRVGEMVQTILRSLDSSFLEGIDVRTELGDRICTRMDRDQFTQVVLNLLRNARDAMPDGGTLRLKVETAMTHDPDEGSLDHLCAVLVVADTGCGMSPEVQKRVFEPLFTTKSRAARRGRGLGMAVVYSAVKNARGFLRLTSAKGEGTDVRVYLPACEEVDAMPSLDLAPATSMTERREFGTPPRGTILIVEEDPLTLSAWTSALESWGYAVLGAAGIEEAGARMRATGTESIALAVLDLRMEGTTALVPRLVGSGLPVRVLLTTDASDVSVPHEIERYVCARLNKPFALEEFASAVAAALIPAREG